MTTFEKELDRLTKQSIEASLREIATALDLRYGSPTAKIVAELRLYVAHLRTWAFDTEEFGAVRPLRDLLNDAALIISLQGCRSLASADTGPKGEDSADAPPPSGSHQ